ncbi:MAG: hypothetical protein K8U57_06515 [Planctomycetes bacterium]|nr:hypothetical protein [Planctomycetota bacterium]
MPIRFRCGACSKLLGIATRKAGTDIACPYCAVTITVPSLAGNDEPVDLSEIDELLNEAAAPPPSPTISSRPSRPLSPPSPSEFMPNVELVTQASAPPPVRPVPVPLPPPPAPRKEIPRTADMTGYIVMSYTRVTVLVIAVAVMLFVAFVAGYRMASRS